MAAEVVIPRLGWSMEEGTFGEWLKADGAVIRTGDPLFVLEGEKSAQDIEAVDAGVLRIPVGSPRAGDTVKVGQVVAWICGPEEACPPLPPVGTPAKPSATAAQPATSASSSASSPTPAVPPTAAAVGHPAQPAPVVPAETIATSGRPSAPASPPSGGSRAGAATSEVTGPAGGGTAGSRGGAGHSAAGGAGAGRLRVTPRARRAAQARGVAVNELAGTGRWGRIRERDVLAVARPAQPIGRHAASTIRKTIAARMLAASQTTAPVTLHRRCDATNLVNLRGQFAGRAGLVVPSYTELLVKLVGCVLGEFPEVRTRWVDAATLETVADCHVAIAVDTPLGLLAPVVERVDQRPLGEVVSVVRGLAAEARAGRLDPAHLTGGVITVTNLGALGIEYFTPVLNLPQVAILGVGAILREAVVVEDEIVIADRLPLSLTFDHRLLDGAPAARFLQAVCSAIENPAAWLVG